MISANFAIPMVDFVEGFTNGTLYSLQSPAREVVLVGEMTIPKCLKCEIGYLVPLSDYGGQGAAVHFKAWVCVNPPCGFNIKIRNGDIYLNEPITPGSMNVPRNR
jgi:hypothetical protein